MSFDPDARVHFVGIGGAGMSAIAKVLVERGIPVSGSDIKRSRAASMLEAMGVPVSVGHDRSLIEGAGSVVYSAAIPAHNVELVRAKELSIPVMTRGEALARVLQGSEALVVAGTHGKTTTTSMIVAVLLAAGRDPTYLVGGGLNDVGTNARQGTDGLAVAESDESDGSFLMLEPAVAVVTNVEADHLDHWGSLAAIREAFEEFIGRAREAVVVPAADPDLLAAAQASGGRVITFGGEGATVEATDVVGDEHGSSFDLVAESDRASVTLRARGDHNVSNALACAGACLAVGLSVEEIANGLRRFRGVERRFQTRGQAGGVTVVDDYAHHPTEVNATLSSTRPGPWRRVVAVFQPHRYSRTAHMADSFGPSFAGADRVVITDVYGAGEQPVPGVTGKLVADSICAALPGRPVAYLPHREELLTYLANLVRDGDVVVTMGAGDITSVGDDLLARMERAS